MLSEVIMHSFGLGLQAGLQAQIPQRRENPFTTLLMIHGRPNDLVGAQTHHVHKGSSGQSYVSDGRDCDAEVLGCK